MQLPFSRNPKPKPDDHDRDHDRKVARCHKIIEEIQDRAEQLQAAAPEPWVELHPDDAAAFGVEEGQQVRVESDRGSVTVAARLNGDRRGQVFLPFHYAAEAANELTMTRWDPVSKQPEFKGGSVRVRVSTVS